MAAGRGGAAPDAVRPDGDAARRGCAVVRRSVANHAKPPADHPGAPSKTKFQRSSQVILRIGQTLRRRLSRSASRSRKVEDTKSRMVWSPEVGPSRRGSTRAGAAGLRPPWPKHHLDTRIGALPSNIDRLRTSYWDHAAPFKRDNINHRLRDWLESHREDAADAQQLFGNGSSPLPRLFDVVVVEGGFGSISEG